MSQPNVVFVIADQHRWDCWERGGNGATYTPNLDRVALAGTLFRRAYCTSPLCCPSRAAIASGQYGVNSGCFTNLHELAPGTPSFVSQFRAAGYRTCAIGKTHMEIHAYDSDLTSDRHRAYMDSLGWDEVCEISGNGMLRTGIRCAYSTALQEQGMHDAVLGFYRQWRYFMERDGCGDPNYVCHPWPFAPELQETAFVRDRALAWLRGQDGRTPFLLHVGFAAPHAPIEPLPAFLDLYRGQPEPRPWGDAALPPWLPDGRRGYRAMISQVDEALGAICRCLEEQGLAQNTVLVYAADHGEMAGDHGRLGKTCFYEGSVRVPLVFAGPGVQQGRESEALVELVDLGKTLCELCSVEAHAQDQGKSLLPVLEGRCTVHRDSVYAEMGCDRMLYDGRYKLMWGDPALDRRSLGRLHLDRPMNIAPSPARLYDLNEDPRELHDLAGETERLDLLHHMLGKLVARANENIQTRPYKSRGAYNPPQPMPGTRKRELGA